MQKVHKLYKQISLKKNFKYLFMALVTLVISHTIYHCYTYIYVCVTVVINYIWIKICNMYKSSPRSAALSILFILYRQVVEMIICNFIWLKLNKLCHRCHWIFFRTTQKYENVISVTVPSWWICTLVHVIK
jgi:hypothetical protein